MTFPSSFTEVEIFLQTYQENIAGRLDLIDIIRLCKLEVSFGV